MYVVHRLSNNFYDDILITQSVHTDVERIIVELICIIVSVFI